MSLGLSLIPKAPENFHHQNFSFISIPLETYSQNHNKSIHFIIYYVVTSPYSSLDQLFTITEFFYCVLEIKTLN